MKRPVQRFTKEYLAQCAKMTPEQIIEFLEDYRQLILSKPEKCQLISLKVEPPLLRAFKQKAALMNVPYQTQIKNLMKTWLLEE